jgi:ADP-heptose:LPS heptosyltransferase
VLSTGLLDHLIRTYPGARITVACGPVAAGLFTRMPGLEDLIVVDKRPYDLHWFTLWREVVWQVWDLVVDLRGSALSFALFARRRAIMRGGRRPGHRLGHLAGTLGLATVPLPVVWTFDTDVINARERIPDCQVIGLGPTANWPDKVWPAKNYVALAAALLEAMPDPCIAIFGGPGPAERAMAAPVLAAIPGALDLVGSNSLPEIAACLARCTIFIGNDSGLMHLAAASGVPTLGLFGPTPASEYAPAGPHTAVAEADGPPGATPMDRLSVATVLAAVYRLLARE